MIAPRSRLLWWFGLAVVPALGAAPLCPVPELAAAGVAAVLLLFVADALVGARRMASVRVSAPALVRLTTGREGRVELRLGGPLAGSFRLLPELPAWVEGPAEGVGVRKGRGEVEAPCSWPCVCSRRGRAELVRCRVEGASPLGLWAVRVSAALASELRAHPNLLAERRNLEALFLRVNRPLPGIRPRRQVGQGREFERLREYLPGDSYDDVDWKATARRSRPISRLFRVERTQEVYVVVDASRLSGRPLAAPGARSGSHALDRFVSAALLLALAAERQGDLYGLVTFSDRVRAFVPARSGKAHFGRCRDALYAVEPERVTPDYGELFAFLANRIRRRALFVVLTSLDDPALAEAFSRHVEVVCRRHVLVVDTVRPAEVRPLFSAGEVSGADDVYRELAGHLQWSELRRIEGTLRRRGVSFALLEGDELCVRVVSQYLDAKQRQIL